MGNPFRTNGLEDQMLKRHSSLLRVVCALFFFAATTGVMASPVGTWKTIDDETGKPKSFVQIYEYQGKYYGKIVKLINPSAFEIFQTYAQCPLGKIQNWVWRIQF